MNPTSTPTPDGNERTKRPTWDQYFMGIAELAAARSPCSRLRVGCVLALENRVVAMGYNGFLPGAPHSSYVRDNHEMATVHAEQNAVADAAKRGVRVDGATAYITHFPCIHCAKLLAAAGVTKIVFGADYNNDELVAVLMHEADVQLKRHTV